MEDGKSPFLCGGVFFFILTQAVRPNASARAHREGVSDDHSDPVVMQDLIYTFTGERGYGTRKDTSAFKNCQSEGGKNVPFNKRADIAVYDDEVKHEYRKALRRMCEFAEWHLDPKKSEWLVKACLYLIDKDQDIADDDLFCVRGDGTFIPKSEVMAGSSFELQPFLLGVLHYILLHRADMNRKGVDTLDFISTHVDWKSRAYNGKLDHVIKRKIDVKWCEMPENMAEAEILETHPDDEPQMDDQNCKESSDSESGKPESKNTIIQHQTNVVQNGENNFNLTNNGTMNFNF